LPTIRKKTTTQRGKWPLVNDIIPTLATVQQIGITQRFHVPIQIKGRIALETHADLDSCAEVDIISEQFARKHQLRQSRLTPPILEAAGKINIPTYNAWEVPIVATDSRGTTRVFTRICVGIDRDPRLEGSPVLLSMTTLSSLRVILDTGDRRWWFHQSPRDFEILQPRKFKKTVRNLAHVFAITETDEPYLLGGETLPKTQGSDTLPTELQGYKDVFSTENSGLLPSHKTTDHAIDLQPGKEPPYGPIYPLSQTELQELREYIEENLQKGRIRLSKSPAGAPILFVPKKDGGLRLCVDYRGLNGVTTKNRHPLPLVSEIIDRVSGSLYFTKIDIKDAYYRIRIKEGDEWKTAFRTRYGHFEYLVMPFGLTNAPATFQSYIHQALRGLLDTICVAYLDDILIFSKDRDSHTQHIKQVLERMREAELYAKPSKCIFYQSQVEFLGYIISDKGVSMDPSRVETVAKWAEPKTYREIQVFLGFCNFYRRFICGYSGTAAPLTALLKGSKNGKKPGSVQLGLYEKLAFRRLIAAFQTAPLLRHFDPQLPVRIETDASKFAMAGILSQPDEEGRWHPVAFWSRKFNGPELNYGTPDQEMMAIVESFKHWRHYTEGTAIPVEVLSDHSNLQVFMRQPKLNGRQARWCMYLTPLNFIIKHRTGKTNPADAPSRQPQLEGEEVPNTDLLPDLERKLVKIQAVLRPRKQGETPLSSEMHDASDQSKLDKRSLGEEDTPACNDKIEGENAPNPERLADWARERVDREQLIPQRASREAMSKEDIYADRAGESLTELIRDAQEQDPEMKRRKASYNDPKKKGMSDVWSVNASGLVCHRDRLFVPEEASLKEELLQLYHDDPLAGHFGINRTVELLQRKFHWRHLEEDVKDYIASCNVCQGTVSKRHRPYGSLESLPIPRRPMDELSMDFVTGLPVVIFEGREVDAILVIVDRFTKFTHFFPVNITMNAADLAELFHKEIELRYGAPRGIISDRGSVFTSKFWSELCFYSKVKRRLSTAFHPQTDGQTERMNQVLEHYLRCFIDSQQANWAQLLRIAQFACNNARNATTKVSPAQALLGFQPEFRIDIEDDVPGGEVPEARSRIQKLEQLREEMRQQWRIATDKQAEHYNKRHQPIVLKRGQLVGLSTKNLKLKGEKKKLAPRFIGPFRVLETIGKQAYRISLPEKYYRLHNVFHISLLEPWKKRDNNTGDTMPIPDLEDNDEEYEVEGVKDIKQIKGQTHYLVKWKGWPAEYNQWVDEEDMEHAQEKITAFIKEKAKKTKIATETSPSRKQSDKPKRGRPRKKT
jgi:transposase InsO family protein